VGYDDDACGAFPQRTFNPSISGANSCILMEKIITCIPLHFGGNFGPASFEPICWARIEVAEFLAHHAKYILEINDEVIQLIKMDEPKSHKTSKMANVRLDKYNPPALFAD
jgi:hypothetical protein